VFVIFALPAGSVAQHPQATVFGTVSIKPSGSSSQHHMESDERRFVVRNWSVRQIVQFAYGLSSSLQVAGAPEWIDTSFYDIDARVGQPGTGSNLAVVGNPGRGDEYPAVEALLRDRFGLMAHIERRPVPALALVVAQGGVKLKAAASTGHSKPGIYDGPTIGILEGKAATTAMLTNALRRLTPTPLVYDMTNLSGAYDFTFHWDAFADSPVRIGPLPYQEPNPNLGNNFVTQCERGQIPGGCVLDSKVPALSTALREELGLELQELKSAEVYVLVIDQITKPTAN
jgi:uncharacterized protein (TIGR03435 family)